MPKSPEPTRKGVKMKPVKKKGWIIVDERGRWMPETVGCECCPEEAQIVRSASYELADSEYLKSKGMRKVYVLITEVKSRKK